jgi:tetratricopeptide (TPR) repeat protein
LLLRMGRQEDAIALYRDSVQRWPDSATSLNALGYTLADRTEDYTEAARLIGQALEMEPHNAAIIDSYGWVLYRQGELEEALLQLEIAYDLLRDPEVAAHIVEVLWKLDREEDALLALDEAALAFPESDILDSIRERVFPDGN